MYVLYQGQNRQYCLDEKILYNMTELNKKSKE